uniref:Putative secreted protein n=1 Tax=Anopheles darlingi TaxID=43151 RepID=A0A2M4DEN6_ANODA
MDMATLAGGVVTGTVRACVLVCVLAIAGTVHGGRMSKIAKCSTMSICQWQNEERRRRKEKEEEATTAI